MACLPACLCLQAIDTLCAESRCWVQDPVVYPGFCPCVAAGVEDYASCISTNTYVCRMSVSLEVAVG